MSDGTSMDASEVEALKSALSKAVANAESAKTQAAPHDMSAHTHSIANAKFDSSMITTGDMKGVTFQPNTHQHSIISTPNINYQQIQPLPPGYTISSGTGLGTVAALPSQTAVTVDGAHSSPKEILEKAKARLMEAAKELKNNLDEAEQRWIQIEKEFIEAGRSIQELEDALSAIAHAEGRTTEPDEDGWDDESYPDESYPEEATDETHFEASLDADMPF